MLRAVQEPPAEVIPELSWGCMEPSDRVLNKYLLEDYICLADRLQPLSALSAVLSKECGMKVVPRKHPFVL